MEEKITYYKEIISNVKSRDISNLIKVEMNMVQKYKKFSHLPRLDKAVLIEDNLGIPARAWVDIKKFQESQS